MDQKTLRGKVDIALDRLGDFGEAASTMSTIQTETKFQVLAVVDRSSADYFDAIDKKISSAKAKQEPKKTEDQSDKIFKFPAKAELAECLSNHESFSRNQYLQEKGVTQPIVELSAQRLANSEMVKGGVALQTNLIIYDLRSGVDGYTNQPLPNLDKALREETWSILTVSTEQALMDCAKKE